MFKFLNSNSRDAAETIPNPLSVRSAPQSGTSLDDSLRDMGVHHEDLRSRCENAVTAMSALRSTTTDIESIFVEFGSISKELHATRKELSEASRLLGNERRVADDLRGKLSTTQSAMLKLEANLEEAVTGRNLLAQSHQELSELHQVSQNTLRDKEGLIKVLEPGLANANATINELTEKVTLLTTSLGQAEQQINELREEQKLLQANLEFEAAEKVKFGRLHDEVVASLNAQRKALTGSSDELRLLREKTQQLESKQAELLVERDTLAVTLDTAKALHEAESKNFEVKIEAVTSRARLAEHLLEKSRDEQRIGFRDQAAHTEALRNIRRLESTIESLKADLQDATKRAKDLEKTEESLKARIEAIDSKGRDKQRAIEQSAEKIKNLQDLLEATQNKHNTQMLLIDAQFKKVAEEVERERADRVYLEGALATARRDRATLQSLLIKLRASSQDDVSSVLSQISDEMSAEEGDQRPSATSNTITELRPGSSRPTGAND